jgi:hypothetical protein
MERDQPRIQCSEVHETARHRDAAGRRFRVRLSIRNVRIVAPSFETRSRIECDHLIEGRDDVHQTIRKHRRGLERRDPGRELVGRRGFGLEGPRNFQAGCRFRRQIRRNRHERQKKQHVQILSQFLETAGCGRISTGWTIK